jgi:hypothetical protein
VNFWASAEVFRVAFPALGRVRRVIEPRINDALAGSTLSNLPGEFRYVPIVMPPEMQHRYPSRSQLRADEGVLVCAPQLQYDVFVKTNSADQVVEYIRGIAGCLEHLRGLGASASQVKEFEAILDGVSAELLRSDFC